MRVGVARVELQRAAEALLGQRVVAQAARRSGRAGCRPRPGSGRPASACLTSSSAVVVWPRLEVADGQLHAHAGALAGVGLVGGGHAGPCRRRRGRRRWSRPCSSRRAAARSQRQPAATGARTARHRTASCSGLLRRRGRRQSPRPRPSRCGALHRRTRHALCALVRSCTSPASWPQAASMSSPRVLRTVVTMPASCSTSAKACTRALRRAHQAGLGERVERDQVELARTRRRVAHQRDQLRAHARAGR